MFFVIFFVLLLDCFWCCSCFLFVYFFVFGLFCFLRVQGWPFGRKPSLLFFCCFFLFLLFWRVSFAFHSLLLIEKEPALPLKKGVHFSVSLCLSLAFFGLPFFSHYLSLSPSCFFHFSFLPVLMSISGSCFCFCFVCVLFQDVLLFLFFGLLSSFV